jgi:hypothetical protein
MIIKPLESGGLVASMAGIFFICLAYEALKFFRDHLTRQAFRSDHTDSPVPTRPLYSPAPCFSSGLVNVGVLNAVAHRDT